MSINSTLADALRPATRFVATANDPDTNLHFLRELAAQGDKALQLFADSPHDKSTMDALAEVLKAMEGVLASMTDNGIEGASDLHIGIEEAMVSYDDWGDLVEVIAEDTDPLEVLGNFVATLEGAASDNEVCEEMVELSGVRAYLHAREKRQRKIADTLAHAYEADEMVDGASA